MLGSACIEGMDGCGAIRAEKMMMNVGQCLYRRYGWLWSNTCIEGMDGCGEVCVEKIRIVLEQKDHFQMFLHCCKCGRMNRLYIYCTMIEITW